MPQIKSINLNLHWIWNIALKKIKTAHNFLNVVHFTWHKVKKAH